VGMNRSVGLSRGFGTRVPARGDEPANTDLFFRCLGKVRIGPAASYI